MYCLLRKKAEETAAFLESRGMAALAYHADMDAPARQCHQERFQREDGVVIVATIAFGMGIDKPDVRFVAHLDLPKSVEGYYQETGRAGLPADAWMAYGLQDVVQLRRMIDESEAGEAQKRIQAAKLDAMLGLCETAECRRVRLLGYFGEAAAPCGNYDTCLDPPATFDGTLAAQQLLSCVYRTGQRFGAMHVIDVLRGEATAKVTQRRHDKLSTFGIGAGRSGREWRAIVRQCIALGLLEVDHDSYGALKLTPASRARTGAKHGSRPGSNARTAQKAALFDEALSQFTQRLQAVEAAERTKARKKAPSKRRASANKGPKPPPPGSRKTRGQAALRQQARSPRMKAIQAHISSRGRRRHARRDSR